MNYPRRCAFLLGAFATLFFEAETPNIILIITDDQSWDSIGFMGGDVHTPRIDKMAEDGLYLSNFNVTSTVCSPSPDSFMTGRFAGNCTGEKFIGIHPPGNQTQIENIGELEPGRWNLARAFQAGGYKTGFVGKSHLIKHEWVSEGGGSHVQNWEKGGFEVYAEGADPKDPEISGMMRRNHERWCDAMKPFGFDFVDGYYAANLRDLLNESLNVHNLEWTASKAFSFFETYKDEPFFLYFSTTLHHGPAPWNNQYSLDIDIRMTGEGFVPEGFDVMPTRESVIRRNKEAGFAKNKAFALWLDDGVGAIIDKVEALGLSENTLIIFVPDHGTYRHGKATLHDFGMRVPMICLWKCKIASGSVCNEIVANIDLAPTLLDIAGIEPAEDYSMDGVSLKNVIFGDSKPVREFLLGELGHSRAVKTKDWKYIAVRYPEKFQRKIDAGATLTGFDGEPIERPYLTRNGHLGHHASKVNPNYFDADQLYNLRTDPEEKDKVFEQNPEVAQ